MATASYLISNESRVDWPPESPDVWKYRGKSSRVLTNSETNSIKKEYIDKLMVEREAEAKKARQLKKKQAYKPDPEASFSWSANTSTRGRR
ncbi:DUF3811 domain-containing protein [Shigella flexneri]